MTIIRTADPAYEAVERDDFPVMLEVERYNARSDAFDEIVSRTHDHFWDPLDPAYIDFSQPFDIEREYIMPPERIQELKNGAFRDTLDEPTQIRLANEITRWQLSAILHGEQGALSLSAGLCHILKDPGAQEYAANQAREEARHVTAFARYIQVRWGAAYPVGDELGRLLNELVLAPEVYKKLVGMQMLLEGLAMGAFSNLHKYTRDPVLKRLVQLVMTDEAFHHRFGKIWAERTIHKLSEAERDMVEDWAASCFESLLFNLVNIRQKRAVYGQFGLQWEQVREATRAVYDNNDRRNELKEGTNAFRVLAKTLREANIITDRTRHVYAAWVDMKGLEAEPHMSMGEAVAADGIAMLREINRTRRPIGQKAG